LHLRDKPPMAEEPQERNYETALRDAGVRITRQRRVILRLLAGAGDHPDAMELYRRAVAEDASVSLTTVYRTLKLLEEKGEIRRHAFEGGPSRFEPADAGHHDHLIDVDTGQVIEFHSEKIETLQREIARGLGYEIVHHRLELYGRKRRGR
jgi:Fur family ferric uptake transcriptional regulator